MAAWGYLVPLVLLVAFTFGDQLQPPSWHDYYTYSVDSKSLNDVRMTMTVQVSPKRMTAIFHNGTSHNGIYSSYFNMFRIYNKTTPTRIRLKWALKQIQDGHVREICWDAAVRNMLDEHEEDFPNLPDLSKYNYMGDEELREVKLEKWSAVHANSFGFSRERTIWIKFLRKGRTGPVPVYMQDRFITSNRYVYMYAFHDFYGFTENESFKDDGDPAPESVQCIGHPSSQKQSAKVTILPDVSVHAGGAVKDIPRSFDWRLRGAVSPVRYLRDCGDWAYAVVGAMEGAYVVQKRKQLPMFSDQFLIDCSWETGNQGCIRGEALLAFDLIKKAGGIPTTYDYGPLLATDAVCTLLSNKPDLYAPIQKIVKAPSKKEDFKAALMEFGPITIKLALTSEELPHFRKYTNGVFSFKDNSTLGRTSFVQVLVVGYGDLDGDPYWLIKGCFGNWWGLEGYMLLSTEWRPDYVLNNAYYALLK